MTNMESKQDQNATIIWNDESAEPPSLPGVYRVKYMDHHSKVDLIAGRPVVAYWDGINTWSFPWATSVKEAYKAKMMLPGRKLDWSGQPLPTEHPTIGPHDRIVVKISSNRPKP